MKIKRYLDKDMRQVLRRVREDQGPDAVILSNRRVEGGIEVIAAIDYDEALVRHALATEKVSEPQINSDALARIAEDDATVTESAEDPQVLSADLVVEPSDLQRESLRSSTDSEHSLQGMQSEIRSLRGLLETQLSGLLWKDESRRSPVRAQVLRNLARIGLAPDIANIVVDRLEPVEDIKSLWHAPLAALAQTLSVKDDRLLVDGGVVALIGPTGVGKTTTIAKIAAKYALNSWSDDIALVSADSYRIGAREHLQAFANIVGVKVYSASTPDELSQTLDRLRDKKLVLIDTEGRSPRDRDLANRMAAYGSNQDRIHFYLTLSAATQEAGLDEAIREFNKVPLAGCIVTKIDEAAQLGCVISTLIRHDLRAAFFSDGQRIPEDLHLAAHKKLWLVNQAIECIDHSQPRIDERLMAERYSQLGVGNA
ncbi:MAG: flagellar biosynthesis protein FlhF [Gammaproteobacteria bacterium]|nr:flagellar biosynthesis protein FlhF [Gammaproteobacteria bacterium]